MLRTATTSESAHSILNEAVSTYNMKELNVEVLEAVIAAKLTNLSSWTNTKTKYADFKARELLDAIAFLRKIRTTDYINKQLGSQLPSKELNSFCTNVMRMYAQRQFSPLLYIEVGRIIELRNNFVESRNYYQNIRSMFDDSTFKKEIDLRIILFLERIADLKNDERSAADALALRKSLMVGSEFVIPTSSSVSAYDWDMLINYTMTISNEIAAERQKRKRINEAIKEDENLKPTEELKIPITVDNSVESTTKDTASNTSPSVTRSTAKQTFRYGDYELSYSPRKDEFVIHYEKGDNEYMIKIKQGKLPESDEYNLVDGRLYFTEINMVTPFKLNLSDNRQIIEIYDGEYPTGLAFTTENGN